MKHLFTKIALVISALALLCCCAQYEAPQISELPDLPVRDNEPAPDSVFANRFELTRIAERTLGISANSRGSELQISEIADSAGNPALYIMQSGIDNGFVIASARKSYWPILAYCEEGSFNQESEMPAPVKEWLDNMTLEVSTSTNNDSIEIIHSIWRTYESAQNNSTSALSPSRLSRSTDDEYWAEITALIHILDDSVQSWRSQGYQAGLLTEIDGISDNLREQWMIDARDGVYPLYTEEWMYLSAVRISYETTSQKSGFELNYKWDQGYPFNQSFPLLSNNARAYVGCTNVAMGMIMRYHQWPSTFNWADMPYNSATRTTSDFLYDIALSNNSNFELYGTGAKVSSATSSLKQKYGYHAKDYDFNYGVLQKNIAAYKPVICSDEYTNSNGKKTGHAWVVSGTHRAYMSDRAEMWLFTSRTRLSMQNAENHSSSGPLMYYVNWGWGGAYNGYFSDLAKANPQSSSSELKKMSIEIYPLK